MTTQTMTQESMYRSEPGTSSQQFGSTRGDAFAALPPKPLARLSYEGAPPERIISGASRYKYFRRPIIPFMNAQPPEVLFAPVEAEQALELPQPEPEPLTKDVECQSMYRETEAQTNPYTPEYVVPAGTNPEVLTLQSLTFGNGLPAGLNEVKMIERARAKREFEASLPPMTDEVSLALRRKMMGEQELRDWNVREEQILEVQTEKVAIFDKDLRERTERSEAHWDERIEHMRQIKLTEKDKEISQIQRRRIKALRKLSEARKHVDQQKEVRDVVTEYAEYGSEVYAPLTRSGLITRDKMAHQYETRPAQLETLDGLLELEASLPAKLLEPTHVTKPKKDAKPVGYTERRARRMQEMLDSTDAALKSAKQARPSEKEQKDALLAAYRDTKPVERPPTPQVMPPEHGEAQELAIILLQRLLRGRAIQNMMYEGKERRLELIRELRIEEALETTTKRDRLEEAAEEAEAGLQAVVDAVQSELVGNSLDRMSKELRRFTEERRVAEIVKKAEKERRVREAQESGRRARELVQRTEQQLAFQQVMKVHQQSAASFIDDICQEVVNNDASAQADVEQEVKESRINTLVDKLEERHSSTGSIASELVHNFLLPEVQRQTELRTSRLEASKYSNAARRVLASAVDKVEEALSSQ
mmetsp:Transcript_42490/g.85191  ORF Transcript_42490/g.85191 Transcript_42490/m.85191 type:complete len:647 (-) Transcript_42490:348-2288(-)